MSVYLRPLALADANTSWQWRNDEAVWRYTGSRPSQAITPDAERQWLAAALQRPDEKRFAICLENTDEYIGNAQLTDITPHGAQLHLFIGARQHWGQGHGRQATAALLQMADADLHLQVLYLQVHPQNEAAIRIYESLGFRRIGHLTATQVLMERRHVGPAPLVSVFMMSYNHGRFIGQALQGVFDQAVSFPLEIVLSDDASPDDTRTQIFQYYRQRPELFRLLLPDYNLGAVKNQWSVFDACTGEFIAMLEGDDYWTHPHKLQQQVTYLQQHPETAITFHNCAILDFASGNFIGTTNSEQQEITTLAELSLTAYPYTPSVVFRAKYLKEFPKSDRKFMSNRTLDLFNAQFGNIKYFDEVMAVYRRHTGGSWSMVSRQQTLFTQLPAYEYYLEEFDSRYRSQFRQNLLNMTNELLYIIETSKDFTHWRKAAYWYFKHQPKSSVTFIRLLSFLKSVFTGK